MKISVTPAVILVPLYEMAATTLVPASVQGSALTTTLVIREGWDKRPMWALKLEDL